MKINAVFITHRNDVALFLEQGDDVRTYEISMSETQAQEFAPVAPAVQRQVVITIEPTDALS